MKRCFKPLTESQVTSKTRDYVNEKKKARICLPEIIKITLHLVYELIHLYTVSPCAESYLPGFLIRRKDFRVAVDFKIF